MEQTMTTSRSAAALEKMNALAALGDHDNDHDLNRNRSLNDNDNQQGNPDRSLAGDPDHDHDRGTFEREHLLGIIHNDKYFRYAKAVLGVYPGVLVTACRLLGINEARDVVKFVHDLPDWRFEQEWRDKSMRISQRRGSYLMTCLKNQVMLANKTWPRRKVVANG